jgi:hypothetical protein
MKILRPNPERILKTQIFQTIRSYVFVAWFPDLSVTIRICILPYLYNLKRQTETNLARILKYIWFSKIIVQNGHSLQSKCEVRKWKHVIWNLSIPLWGYQFSMGHVTSVHQGLCFPRANTLGTRLVTSLTQNSGNNKKIWYLDDHLIKFNETWHT